MRMDKAARILVAIGTRPEAIKLAPVISELKALGMTVVVLATGQHREQLELALDGFGITPDDNLDVMTDRQTLPDLMSRLVPLAAASIRQWKPDCVVVQGDTLSAFTVALAAFFERTAIAHVEAGLRSGLLHEPFPEEASRRMADVLSDLALAPTPRARQNLLAEGKAPESVVVTGQTVVDAIRLAAASNRLPENLAGGRLITVTMHRRESWPLLGELALALRTVSRDHPDFTFVYPMHRNPVVREAVIPVLAEEANFLLSEPWEYGPMAALMAASDLIVTDSGGMLEEGVSLGTPVAVLRNVTERPEGIEMGLARLVGTRPERIIRELTSMLAQEADSPNFSAKNNPYGDGHAGRRVAQAIAWQLGQADRPEDWVPGSPNLEPHRLSDSDLA